MDYALGENPNLNPNPNLNRTLVLNQNMHDLSRELEFLDYLLLDDAIDHIQDQNWSSQKSMESMEVMEGASTPATSYNPTPAISTNNMIIDIKCKSNIVVKKQKLEVGQRVAFRTKSEMEVMDDGFKWRKYGKKSVKNNPNPRNYYKCSSRGCHVKKRIERDKEDPSYVITTYEGTHNHESPCIVYCNQMPFMLPSLQLSPLHSATSS